ncbi:MAG: copper resistance protein CopC [Actinobacteria bacterium]|nr:copper resistance protein CopC [Actinomycetota bacterium]MBU1943194.1 copper resistance protein CopC [Actinomycetota bacterium]MBU2687872.1 copper resistance protein CopC [Actinomycetota bacterium]
MRIKVPGLLVALLIVACSVLAAGCGETAGEVKAPRFTDSTPMAGDVYAAQPVNVTLNFQVDLARGSSISVVGAGEEWATGPVLIEDQSTAMKRALKQGMREGEYSVRYTARYASGSTGEGRSFFRIDPAMLADYEDLQGRSQVTIRMTGLAFLPRLAVVSPGTTITWVNEEQAAHFVNTETHPEHTYVPEMNSKELKQGESFSVTLETPGQYDYHCSAHYPQGMKGSIVVAE